MRSQLLSVVLLSLAAFAGLPVSGQSDDVARKRLIPPPPFPPPPPPPVVWVRPELKPMSLSAASVDIKVRGHLATTRMELAFHNPNGRVIEGELVFPLGEGQSVSGYELEVDGRMRQAVAVPKDQGREIFEDVVRRGVDPGLAELTKGNVFRTRLYPIPANGIKKVAISFEQELADTGTGFRYVLPLGWKEQIGTFSARVEAVKQEGIPISDADKSEPLTFTKWNDSFVAELKKEKYTPSNPLAFTVPKQPNTPTVFMVPDRLEPAQGWFTVRVEPVSPPVKPAPPLSRVAVFYDASGSAPLRDREKEMNFLKTWLKDSGATAVDLVVFRNEADPVQSIALKDGDAAPLLEVLRAAPLDGGTSLGAINVASVPESQMAVLITDGQSNFGPSAPKLSRTDGKAIPVFTVHAAQAANYPVLDRIARSGAGQAVNLLTTSDADAMGILRGQVFRFLGVKVLSGAAMDTAPALPVAVTRGFTLAGRYKGKTEMELTFGYGTDVVVSQRVTLDPSGALEPERGAFVKRVWAQKRIAELLPEPKENEAAITQLGKDNGLVTPFTSLLVLERIEDYARYNIEPPEPELREAWLKLAGELKKQIPPQQDKDYLQELAKQWKEFREWHAKRHPWLETVLAPAAQRETEALARLVGPSGSFKSLTDSDLKLARSIAEQAQSLAKRWLKEGAESGSRTAWEKEAVGVMMQLDTLRQKRLEAAPETGPNPVAESSAADSFRGGGFGGRERGNGAPMPRPAELRSPSPAAPPPLAAAEPLSDAAPKSDGDATRAKNALGGESRDSRTSLESRIEVKPWNPDTPYLKKIRTAADAYAAYLEERKANAASSAFYLDCSDFFREEKKDDRLSLRILSNLAEMDYESAPLVRILAYRLQQLKRFDLAVPLFEEVLTMRPEEPQSRRDLALALSRQPQPDVARAAKLLWEVAGRRWNGRFDGIGIITLHELNALLDSVPA
ncbi:MAG TPA: VIT domain-containing protein, partial [Verrucomicrobiales bacterium]|nr:VIT domain-containing protein [Verrucomicrobiales bacterium]